MKHQYYFPFLLAKQREWAVNYKEKIAVHGAALGMSPTQITEEQDKMDLIIAAIDKVISIRKDAQQYTKDKNQTLTEVMDVMRENIRGHKANSGYTEGIGEALGIIGEEIGFDPLTVKTIVSLTPTVAGVDIKFELKGCEGGNVYCKRGNEEQFTFFKHLTHPHSIDTRANIGGAPSEHREYYVNLVLHDEEVGKSSDIASIKV